MALGAVSSGLPPKVEETSCRDLSTLRKSVEDALRFCTGHGVDLAVIETLPAGSMDRLQKIDDAVNLLIAPGGAGVCVCRHLSRIHR